MAGSGRRRPRRNGALRPLHRNSRTSAAGGGLVGGARWRAAGDLSCPRREYVGREFSVFGAPLAHEDDPERAIRASLDMHGAIARLNENAERDRGVRLSLRVGVNTGAVVAGPLAGKVQSAYTIVGDAVNTAQRLQSAAAPGEILVGPITRRLADRAFTFAPLEPIRVKGKTAPLVVFKLVGLRASPETATVRRPPPLVGRAAGLPPLVGGLDRGPPAARGRAPVA